MGEVYSHLSEEERQVIQIEIGNGAGIRAIGAMIKLRMEFIIWRQN